MKEVISYLYKIEICDELYYENKLILKTSNNNYLCEEISDKRKIYKLNQFINDLNQQQFFCYKFKVNIYNEIVSKYQDKEFVLIELFNDYEKSIDFEDMLIFYKKSSYYLVNRIKYINIWDILWEQKIDYLTVHFNNNLVKNRDYELLFYYYISTAENALQYINKIKKKYQSKTFISFVHRRIKFPCDKFDFYNPLNFIIDFEIRDIGEYIKSLYYSNEDYITELNFYLHTHKIDSYLGSLLYARIIYPSVFLDDYESSSIDINKYIRFDLYEEFIKKIYDLISSYIFIDKIDCLN